jgi:hypothetical protein
MWKLAGLDPRKFDQDERAKSQECVPSQLLARMQAGRSSDEQAVGATHTTGIIFWEMGSHLSSRRSYWRLRSVPCMRRHGKSWAPPGSDEPKRLNEALSPINWRPALAMNIPSSILL